MPPPGWPCGTRTWSGSTRRSTRRGSGDRKSTRLNSSHLVISYAVFCLKKKNAADELSGRRSIGFIAIVSGPETEHHVDAAVHVQAQRQFVPAHHSGLLILRHVEPASGL